MERHLFLTGFMGAGKTSVAQAMGADLGLPVVDLDQKIVELAGKSIEHIFSDEGEEVFRDFESDALRSLANSLSSVVATGGGIVGRPENRTFMHEYGTVVYLSAEWETLKQRIGDTAGRPLAQTDNDWSATRNLWLKRSPLYAEADMIVKTDHRTIAEIISEIKTNAKF